MTTKTSSFTTSAKFYDAIYKSKNYQNQLDYIFASVPEIKNSDSDVLEIGCGTGNFTEVLKDHFRGVDAIDPEEQMILLAQKKQIPRVNFFHSRISNFKTKNIYKNIFSLFHVVSYMGAGFEDFISFSSSCLENERAKSEKRFLIFDYYDTRGVEKNPPQNRSSNFVQDGRILTRQVTVESVQDTAIHLLIRIADDRERTLSIENHQLKVFEISKIRVFLEQNRFQVVDEIDLVHREKYSAESYGNCIIAMLR